MADAEVHDFFSGFPEDFEEEEAEEPAANSESWRKWMQAAASASSLRHSAARSARHQQGKSWICSLYRAPISMTGGQRSVIKDSAVNSLMEMLGFVWQRCWALLARRTTAKAEHAPPSANAQQSPTNI